jgi:hypothetical protein
MSRSIGTLLALCVATPAMAWEFEGGWTPLSTVIPVDVNGTAGVTAQLWTTADQSYSDLVYSADQTWHRPGIPILNSSGNNVGAHPWTGGHSILRVALEGRDPTIRVRGAAGGYLAHGGGRNGYRFAIYKGEGNMLEPLWERDFEIVPGQNVSLTEDFDLEIPYEDGDELFFLCDAKGQSGTDWANWYGVEFYQAPPSQFTVGVVDEFGEAVPGSQIALDTDADGTLEWYADGDTAVAYAGAYDAIVLPGLEGDAQDPIDRDAGLYRELTVELDADAENLQVVWPHRDVVFDVVAPSGEPVVGSFLVMRGVTDDSRRPSPVRIRLPVNHESNTLGAMSNGSDGYDMDVIPGISGVAQDAEPLLWRTDGDHTQPSDESFEVSPGAGELALDVIWPGEPCSFTPVNDDGTVHETARTTVPDVLGLLVDRWLPATLDDRGGPIEGEYADGYPIEVVMDGSSSPQTVLTHVLGEGGIWPESVEVDGETFELACRSFSAPTCEDISVWGRAGTLFGADYIRGDMMVNDADGDRVEAVLTQHGALDGVGSVSDGRFSWIPTEAGSTTFSVEFTDVTGQSAVCNVDLTVGEEAAFSLTVEDTHLAEADGQTNIIVELLTAPIAPFSIVVTVDDDSEAVLVGDTPTFTPEDWGPRTLVVQAVDDDLDDGDQLWDLVATPQPSDDRELADLPSRTLWMTTVDDDASDLAGLPSTPITTDETGVSAEVAFALGAEPMASVTVHIAVSDDTEVSVSPTSLVFETADWDVSQVITVTGLDDDVVDGSVEYVLELSYDTTDPGYMNAPANTDIIGVNHDDDAGLGMAPLTDLSVSESGTSATFDVWLIREPSAPVTVTFGSTDDSEALAPEPVTIVPADWDSPVAVAVVGLDDDEVDGDVSFAIVVLDVSSDDVAFDGLEVDEEIAFTNVDDDQVAMDTGVAGVDGECGCQSTGPSPMWLAWIPALFFVRRTRR